MSSGDPSDRSGTRAKALTPEAARQHESDVVRSNSDLAGQWPNVKIRCALVAHGSEISVDGGAAAQADQIAPLENWVRIGAALTSDDVDPELVGVEAGGGAGVNRDDILSAFARVNETIIRLNAGEGIDFQTPQTSYELMLIGLVMGMHHGGARQLPLLMPIDAYDDRDIQTLLSWQGDRGLNNLESAALSATIARERESLVVQQTFLMAQQVAATGGQQRVIAIVQGANHSPTPEAMTALGADVVAVLVDPPITTPRTLLRDRIRAGKLPSDQREALAEAEQFAQAELLGAQIFSVFDSLERFTAAIASNYERAMTKQRMRGAMGMVCLVGLNGSLPPQIQTAFDQTRRWLDGEHQDQKTVRDNLRALFDYATEQ